MKNVLRLAVVCLGIFGLCGSLYAAGGRDRSGKIIINYPTFQTGVNTAAPVIEQLIVEFNKQYEGKYEIRKEDVPGDQNYVDKINVQLGTGDMPPVVYGGGYNLLDPALARDVVVDLTGAVNADPAWKALYSEASMVTNTRDGRIYASSSEGSVIGYFYNKELFAKAGIAAPAKTWTEFFSQCERLKAAGIIPMSMDTADSAWVSMLWMGAMVATENAAGLTFMKRMMPDNYNTPEMIKAARQIQNIFRNYTTVDAVGGGYEHAANNFLSGKTAMIANGPWMMGDFSDTTKTSAGFDGKVGVAIYPGNFVYDAPIQGYFVTKQRDPALQAAAVEMVKFFTSAHAQQVALEIQGMVPSSPAVQISAAAKQKWPLLVDFLNQANTAQFRSDNLQATMYPNLLDIVSQELPRLATGDITPEAFCQLLTEGAAKNK
ncbi:MAG: extracellular solute-binding protein [Spirochaetaceae bacterium]|jgi:raffinose/stachyose/melibiose transport system substrate-binding protein|nr:extracellular solute-binding protein [Spirochaetaceae bacterium]